jgi:hypothetical protein
MSRRRLWNLGDEVLVTPDLEQPERMVKGVVVGLRNTDRNAIAVKLVGDPVWDGAVLYQRGGGRADAVKVERIA